MTFIAFPACQLVSYEHMPLTLISLEDWSLVNIIGDDSKTYIQKQITADVLEIDKNQHILTAHCDHKGKMWSVVDFFHYGEGFGFIERRSLHDIHLSELKRYILSSKVTFVSPENIVLLGVAGFQARTELSNLFDKLPEAKEQVVNDHDVTLLWIKYPAERFLIIANVTTAKYIIKRLHAKAQINNSQQWLALNIEGGIPVIDAINSRLFTPLDCNLQEFGGINFKKGCYIGQEIIARMKLRNINKQSMYHLFGTANKIPIAGDNIRIKTGNDRYRYIGKVLAAVELNDKHLHIQAILNNTIELSNIFYIKNDADNLRIKSLPYS